MTKAELISAIAEKTELTKKDSTKALDAITATIQRHLQLAARYSSLVSVHSSPALVQLVQVSTPRQRSRSRSRQQRFPLSRLVRLLRTQLLSKQQRLCPTIWHSAV